MIPINKPRHTATCWEVRLVTSTCSFPARTFTSRVSMAALGTLSDDLRVELLESRDLDTNVVLGLHMGAARLAHRLPLAGLRHQLGEVLGHAVHVPLGTQKR